MSSLRSYSTIGHSHGSTQRNSFPLVQRSASAVTSRQHNHRGVMINGLVRNGISGILYKRANYSRGWYARWFVFQDGVLLYFKIHDSNKLVLNSKVERGSMVIGEESLHRIANHRNNSSRQSKLVYEIHLMVYSIRESKSDERRFSVRTGAKERLHLRAESREDRKAWVEALRAVKGLYPRSPKNVKIINGSARDDVNVYP